MLIAVIVAQDPATDEEFLRGLRERAEQQRAEARRQEQARQGESDRRREVAVSAFPDCDPASAVPPPVDQPVGAVADALASQLRCGERE
ncbi:hypothetical protein OG874_44045 [Nocardia sp. NBC_00565]|uniref:hypothetical protein n=1 Tax=Nocardia sp. NBC_00565 TaxID=2975993 RepID=UPI002E820247|nr:hypothetical protein [Nocardia sp. NBC_00565]WUC03540.1 hypothetical protein OG874_44045 [Nocardia sp. NBC_00565]